jgi:hypothetical protein
MSASAEHDTEMVLVPAARLKELEEIESHLPELIEKARIEGGMDRLKVLHEKRKANPADDSKKALERYYKNREEICAKRRAAYKAKKEAAATVTTGGAGTSSMD